ncbi:hypothetical protein, partial [Vibrio parahaemolyticus]|uniref:hypothetical protein n=1 Tax=Vibrio parahaemolyticus TaxID=670 RepID=UPI0021149D3B
MSPSTHTFRAAVVQASPVVFDRERTLEKAAALTADEVHDAIVLYSQLPYGDGLAMIAKLLAL